MIRTFERNTVVGGEIKTQRTTVHVKPRSKKKLGVMMVGWGGNNGSTFTAGVLAHQKKLTWRNKRGRQTVDFLGSLYEYGSVPLGDQTKLFRELLEMHAIDDLVIGGWDISSLNLYEACVRNQVIDPELLDQLKEDLEKLCPLPSVYDDSFVAKNQSNRADNCLRRRSMDQPLTKQQIVAQFCNDIQLFKEQNNVDQVIVLWTASTERFHQGEWKCAADLLLAIDQDDSEISPSILFAIASITKGAIFLNGSPQNTICPAVIDFAKKCHTYLGGEDFKTGQTKLKSVLVDFLASSGIRPLSIVSYNHLGNNDGKNLDEAPQFRSKEITKRNVIDDVVEENRHLIPNHPDHTVVIKYIPAVGDSKRAIDEYYSQLFLDGRHTLAIYNTCEDSLLAVPIMLDLIMFAELFSRISFEEEEFKPVLSRLSFFFKAPVVNEGEKVVNAFFKQRYHLENFFRVCTGYPPNDFL